MVNLTFRDERFFLAFKEGSVGGKIGVIDSYGVTNLGEDGCGCIL